MIELSETEEGESIKTFVRLVEQHGEGKLWAAVKSVTRDERDANIILSTAHKAKGREWQSVRLSNDFTNAREAPESAAEVRLFYVAMTRAKEVLCVDPETLQHFSSDDWKAPKDKTKPAAAHPTQRRYARPPSNSPTGPRQPKASTPLRTAPPPAKSSFWKKIFGS